MFIHQRRRVVRAHRGRGHTPRVVEAATRNAKLVGLLSLTATVIAFGATAVASAATWSVGYPPFQATSNVPFAPLQGVSAVSASNAWAVGRDDGAPLTEHWNGNNWSSVALPAGPCSIFENDCQLTGVSADSASDAIAVGNGVLNSNSSAGWIAVPLAFHWNGSGWRPMTLPSSLPSSALDHVQAFSPAMPGRSATAARDRRRSPWPSSGTAPPGIRSPHRYRPRSVSRSTRSPAPPRPTSGWWGRR